MEDKLTTYYTYLKEAGANVPADVESFRNTLSDENKARTYHQYLRENGFNAPESFDSFSSTLELKKKGLTAADIFTHPASLGLSKKPSVASAEKPITEPLSPSVLNKPDLALQTPPQRPFEPTTPKSLTSDYLEGKPIPRAPVDTGSYAGDFLQRLGAGLLNLSTTAPKAGRLVKGIWELPIDMIKEDFIKQGMSEEEAEETARLAKYAQPTKIGKYITVGSAVLNALEQTSYFKKLKKKEADLQANSARYDATAFEYAKNKEWDKAIGASFLSAAESLPISIAAGFGGPAGLGAMGIYSAGEQYDQLAANADMTALGRVSNATLNGALEIVTEKFGTAEFGKLVKTLYKTAGKEVAEDAIKKGLRGWLSQQCKKWGIYTAPVAQGLEEAVNQLGGNITARFTGEDPDRPLDYGVFDAAMGGAAGGVMFTAMGAPAQLRQQKYEERKKIEEKVKKQVEKIEADREKAIADAKTVAEKDETSVKEAKAKINEEFDSKKEEAEKQLGEFKLGSMRFETQEDLTNWLDQNYNETDKFGAVNEEGYLEPNTMKVFNEWYKKNKTRLQEEELKRVEEEQKPKERAEFNGYKVGDTIQGDKLQELSGGNTSGKPDETYVLKQKPLSEFTDTREDIYEDQGRDAETTAAEDVRIENMKKNFDKTPPIPEEGDGLHRIVAAKELGHKTILVWEKVEEEQQNAERVREQTESTGQPTQGVVEGEEGSVRLRDTAEDRVETEQGEEVRQEFTDEKTLSEYAQKKVEETKETGRFTNLGKVGGTIFRVLKNLDPNLSIVVLEGDKAVENELRKLGATPSQEGYNGFYLNGKIYLNSARFNESTPIHEALHPIINAFRQIAPERYKAWTEKAYNQPITIEQEDGTQRSTTYGEILGELGYGATTMDESLVTFLEDFVNDNIDYSKIGEKSVMQMVKQMVIDLFDKLGIDLRTAFGQTISLDDVGTLKGLASSLTKAFQEGKTITTEKEGVDSRKPVVTTEGGIQYLEGKAEDFPITQGVQAKAVSLMKGQETLRRFGLKAERSNVRKIGEALEKRTRAKYGIINKDDRSESALKKIASWMKEEVQYFLEEAGSRSGKGWYGEKYQTALDDLSAIFPEFKTDPTKRDLFTMLIAVTSDGTKVMDNFKNAAKAYEQWKKAGRFPDTGLGQRMASYLINFRNIERLLDQYNGDIERVKKKLLTVDTISNFNKTREEGVEELKSKWPVSFKVPYAAAVFGPKLGMFYANLSGMENYPTLDRWWSRTFNRYRGTLIPEITRGVDTKGRPVGIDRYRAMKGIEGANEEEVISNIIQDHDSYKAKGFKRGTDIEKAANTIYKKMFEELVDAPFGAKDRLFMYNAFQKTQKSLKASGKNLSIADIQAILWYFEKSLYKKLGSTQPALGMDYHDAALETVKKWKESGGSFNYSTKEFQDEEDINTEEEEEQEGVEVEVEEEVGVQASLEKGRVLIPKDWDIDEEGDNFLFYHYGDIKGDAIDPKFFGKNAYTSDKRSVKVSYFYTKSNQRERMVSGKPHVVVVPKEKVYPFNEDPLGFYEIARDQFKKENPDIAFDAPKQIDRMNPMIADAGYDMVVAKWDAFPLRAESIKPLKFDKEKTENFGKAQKGSEADQLKEAIYNDILRKASNNPALSAIYSKGIEPILANPKLRKFVDKKLLAQYEASTAVQASIPLPKRGDFKTTGLPIIEEMERTRVQGEYPNVSEFVAKVVPEELSNKYDKLYEIASKTGLTVNVEKGSVEQGSLAGWQYGMINFDPYVLRAYAKNWDEFIEALNHEVIHGLINRGIKESYALHKELSDIWKKVQDKFNSADDESKEIIAYIADSARTYKAENYETGEKMGDLEELITYAFTNKAFAEFLQSIPSEGTFRGGGEIYLR